MPAILLLAYFLMLITPILLIAFCIFYLLGDFMGAPYVPTYANMVGEILKEAHLKRDQVFIELGSGDGRVVRQAAREYSVKAIGVEIHPLLVLYAKVLSKIQKIQNIKFVTGNLFHTDLTGVDVVFLFLLPKTLKKLRSKLLKECKKGTLIISHGFKIEGWGGREYKKIDRKLFPTYLYKI